MAKQTARVISVLEQRFPKIGRLADEDLLALVVQPVHA
jgi:hypothetical protein